MPLGLLGKKLGMTQIFDESGSMIPVTVILAGPNFVVQKRNIERDGYEAVQLGFDERPERNVNKPDLGNFRKADAPPCYFLREFRGAETQTYEVGQKIGVCDVFEDGDRIDVIGTSKGRGFASVRKRHNSRPGPKSHGSMYHNRPGSGGASSYPSRTWKGKHNPGHHGTERVTAQNLRIVKRDPEKNILFVRGSVPGANNGYVMIRKHAK
ncbi:MAG: large subunit ribosomal protein [Candidatus Sumerlaeota bacterium]|nr:large subunit ribosomal protein [Candidatus Sumerlaeota bacterium]